MEEVLLIFTKPDIKQCSKTKCLVTHLLNKWILVDSFKTSGQSQIRKQQQCNTVKHPFDIHTYTLECNLQILKN